MNQKAAHQTKPSLWVSNIKAFFNLPNPNIVTLFAISSTATCSLGIAMMIDWGLYGKHHPGYHWIIYYASSMIVLPVLVWIICITSAISFHNKDQNLHTLPLFDPSKSEKSQTQVLVHQETQVDEVIQPEGDQVLEDQLAMVQVETVHEDPSGLTKEHVCTSLVSIAPERYNIDDKSTLKRIPSLPILTHTSTDNSSIKRTLSF